MAKKSIAKGRMLRFFDTTLLLLVLFVSVTQIDCVCCPLPVKG